jgi:hemerythrin
LLARLGGDEFLVLLGAASADDAMGLAAKLIDSIAAPYRLGEQEVRIGVSIGVANYPATADQIESLVAAADEALYLSKAQGRNRSTLSAPRPAPGPRGTEYHAAFLAVDESLLLGASDLDQTHLALAEQLNRIEKMLHDGAPRETLLEAFDQLARQFVAHLAHEDDWLNDHLPANHIRHRSNPTAVQAEIRLLRDELDGSDAFLGLIKVRDWLVDHIRSDERLRPLINTLPSKV